MVALKVIGWSAVIVTILLCAFGVWLAAQWDTGARRLLPISRSRRRTSYRVPRMHQPVAMVDTRARAQEIAGWYMEHERRKRRPRRWCRDLT